MCDYGYIDGSFKEIVQIALVQTYQMVDRLPSDYGSDDNGR